MKGRKEGRYRVAIFISSLGANTLFLFGVFEADFHPERQIITSHAAFIGGMLESSQQQHMTLELLTSFGFLVHEP